MTRDASTHLDKAELTALLGGELEAELEAAAEAHLTICQSCSERLDFMAGVDRFQEQFGPAGFENASAVVASLRLLEPGDRMGRYVIEEQIAAGGSAVVYRGREVDGERRVVAIKVSQPSLHRAAESLERFLLEAKVGSHVQDPGILPVLHVECTAEPPWLVMPFVEGETLQTRMERRGNLPLPLDEVLFIAKALASAMQAAHEAGVLHRDVKPSNVLLGTEGPCHERVRAVYLADFGLARLREQSVGLTRSGTFLGTPQFMSPEQAGGGPNVDVGTDLFSLGAVFYMMVTGRVPFAGETFGELAEAVQEKAPEAPHAVNPDLPRWLSNLISRLLTKDPTERLAAAGEVLQVLQTSRDLGTVTAWRLVGKKGRQRRRLRTVAASSGVCVLLLLLVLSGTELTGRTSLINAWLCSQSGEVLYIRGKFATYPGLPEVIAAAEAGDVIEIRSANIPNARGGIHIPVGKPLTLRAADGFAPSVRVQASGNPPAAVIESAFTMEGITMLHEYVGPRPGRLLEVRAGGSLRVLRSRLVRPTREVAATSSPLTSMIGLANAVRVSVEDSEIYAPGSPLIGVMAAASGSDLQVELKNSILWGRVFRCVRAVPEILKLSIEDCELVSTLPLAFEEGRPAEKLEIFMRKTLVHSFGPLIQFPETLGNMAQTLKWQGTDNLFLLRDGFALAKDGKINMLEDWRHFFKSEGLVEAGSLHRVLKEEPPDKRNTWPIRIEGGPVSMNGSGKAFPAGNDMPRVGVYVDKVGPLRD